MLKQLEMEEYRTFTTPAELQKAVNTLHGMISGIASDNIVRESEIVELTHWCSLHENLRDRHPFSELLPLIDKTLEDGVIDEDEKHDILWLCANLTSNVEYYDIITSSIQFLSGFVHGTLSDGELANSEILFLEGWLKNNQFLRGTYPYDELYSLVAGILEDRIVTAQERETLMAFMGNLIEFKDSYNLIEADYSKLREKYSVQGICAFQPEVTFDGRLFCFTGASYKGTRAELVDVIESLGGSFRSSVSKKTDYLIVGNAGNPCWAYSCYGRKIEEALALRKAGGKVQIVNEMDFWEAVNDVGN